MNIGSICQQRIVTIDSESSLTEAARLMRDHHVGALVVSVRTDDGARVSGMVTDRDLVIGALANGFNPAEVRTGSLARGHIISVPEEDDPAQAIAAMRECGVHRLLVTNARQELVGIISFDDLVKACATQLSDLAAVTGRGIEHESPGAAIPPPPLTRLRMPPLDTTTSRRAHRK
ncbi:MAG: CBS domain-containing protein [Methyloversatilis sp.]|jgi:CBS domain-containing protein|nr:CBS domain-containing protein [Methyloversatilis sp.]MBP6195205.1 CBS domain-containing protein [Methyloversatilis sp.]